MTTSQNDPIGLIALPALVQTLTDAGYDVVTSAGGAEGVRKDAAALQPRLTQAPFPLLIADEAVPGTAPWLDKTLRVTPAVLLAVDLPEDGRRIGGNTAGTPRMALPATLGEIFSAVGLSAPAQIADVVLRTDRSVGGTQAVSEPLAPALPEEPVDISSWATDDVAVEPAEPTRLGNDHQGTPAPEAPARPATVVPAPAPVASAPVVPAITRPFTPSSTPAAWPAPAAAPGIVPQQRPAAAVPTAPPAWPVPAAAPAPVQAPVAPAPAPALVRPAAPAPVAAPVTTTPAPEPASYAQDSEDDQLDMPVRAPGKVILSFAGKGGVGKTSLAMLLAQRAAAKAGLRTVLIDGNRGQGDTRTFLKLTKAELPTIYDIAMGADPRSVFVTPDHLAANRPEGTTRLVFALVMAPPGRLADREVVTSEVYSAALSAARKVADLVVVDTQIAEDSDTSGLFDELWIPALVSYAWGLGISDLSTPGMLNLRARLVEFAQKGVGTTRIATVLNRAPESVTFKEQDTAREYGRFGRYLGRVASDDTIIADTDHGNLPYEHPELAKVLDAMLFQVTGLDVFAPVVEAAPAKKARARWFRR